MLGFMSPKDLEDYQRLINEAQTEEHKKAAKPFVHREMPASKCPSCQLAVTRQQKRVCEASGMPIIETSGCGSCAYLPIARVSDD